MISNADLAETAMILAESAQQNERTPPTAYEGGLLVPWPHTMADLDTLLADLKELWRVVSFTDGVHLDYRREDRGIVE